MYQCKIDNIIVWFLKFHVSFTFKLIDLDEDECEDRLLGKGFNFSRDFVDKCENEGLLILQIEGFTGFC